MRRNKEEETEMERLKRGDKGGVMEKEGLRRRD
jgi:hypothetical protein